MNTKTAVDALSALAHDHRLAIYRVLVQRGAQGLPAGSIGKRVGLAPSSLTFHLQALHRAGLVTRERQGRQLIYAADFASMNALVGFITENCCAESDDGGEASCAPSNRTKKTSRAA